MKKLLLLSALLLPSCLSIMNKSRIDPTDAKPKKYAHYISECNQFPYPDSIYIDPCFEFDCHVKKFLVWDHTCENAPQANALTESNREYYGKLEDYR